MNHVRSPRLLRGLRPVLLLVPLLSGPAALGQGALQPAQREHLDRLAGELGAIGLALDLGALELAVRPRAELRALLLEDLRSGLGADRADLLRLLLEEEGRAFASGDELLASLATARTRQQAGVYRPDARQLVVVEEALDELASGAHDAGLLVALAQAAWQQTGAGAFARPADPSLDDLLARRAVVQGGALADAKRALEARGEGLSALHWVRALEGGRLDEEIWRAGLEAFQAVRTDEARRRLWEGADSSEMLLHPIKRGHDAPTEVPLPPWPEKLAEARLVAEDTVGELGIRALLIAQGTPRLRCEVASIGWDGDRLRHYVTAEGEDVLIWRTLWDRPEDAQGFADEWRRSSRGQVRLGGHVVDWVLAEEKGVWNKLLKAFDAFHQRDQASNEDAATSERIENELIESRRSAPYVVANEWRHPHLDLTVVVPVGWYEVEEDGRSYMVREKTAGFRDNVHVVKSPFPDAETLDEVLAINEKRLRADDVFEFISAEKRKLGDTDVGLLRYAGHQGAHSVIYSTLVVLREGEQIGVTVAFEESHWEHYHATVEQILNSVRLGHVPRRED